MTKSLLVSKLIYGRYTRLVLEQKAWSKRNRRTDMKTTEGEEEIASGAHIPIPTETFLEELSVKMHLHPISIYWLLEELKAEGARCKPEELRLLEDRLSVLDLALVRSSLAETVGGRGACTSMGLERWHHSTYSGNR